MANKPYNTSYNRSGGRKRRQPETSPEQAIIESIASGIWSVLKWLFGKASSGKKAARGAKQHRRDELAESWGQVELFLMQEHTRALAVSEGDKILDAALQLTGIAGESMAERLKNADEYFPGELYQQIWDAHKLRNVLAHEVGVQVSTEQASQAVAAFRSALYYLQVLS